MPAITRRRKRFRTSEWCPLWTLFLQTWLDASDLFRQTMCSRDSFGGHAVLHHGHDRVARAFTVLDNPAPTTTELSPSPHQGHSTSGGIDIVVPSLLLAGRIEIPYRGYRLLYYLDQGEAVLQSRDSGFALVKHHRPMVWLLRGKSSLGKESKRPGIDIKEVVEEIVTYSGKLGTKWDDLRGLRSTWKGAYKLRDIDGRELPRRKPRCCDKTVASELPIGTIIFQPPQLPRSSLSLGGHSRHTHWYSIRTGDDVPGRAKIGKPAVAPIPAWRRNQGWASAALVHGIAMVKPAIIHLRVNPGHCSSCAIWVTVRQARPLSATSFMQFLHRLPYHVQCTTVTTSKGHA
ncbi:hypothetical protein Tco_1265366 [Tanacetum coccineum]